jgi:hypothetical protein
MYRLELVIELKDGTIYIDTVEVSYNLSNLTTTLINLSRLQHRGLYQIMKVELIENEYSLGDKIKDNKV